MGTRGLVGDARRCWGRAALLGMHGIIGNARRCLGRAALLGICGIDGDTRGVLGDSQRCWGRAALSGTRGGQNGDWPVGEEELKACEKRVPLEYPKGVLKGY